MQLSPCTTPGNLKLYAPFHERTLTGWNLVGTSKKRKKERSWVKQRQIMNIYRADFPISVVWSKVGTKCSCFFTHNINNFTSTWLAKECRRKNNEIIILFNRKMRISSSGSTLNFNLFVDLDMFLALVFRCNFHLLVTLLL